LRLIRQFEAACGLGEHAGNEGVELFNPRSCALLGRDRLALYESVIASFTSLATILRDNSVGKSIGGGSP
jgi:hypothetical protein